MSRTNYGATTFLEGVRVPLGRICRIVAIAALLLPVVAAAPALALVEDYGVTAITSPSGSGNFSIAEPLTVTVENFGQVAISVSRLFYRIEVRVNGSLAADYFTSTTDSTSVSPGNSVSVSNFRDLPDLSNPGTYEITVSVLLPADMNTANNSATTTLVGTSNFSSTVIDTFPYSEDFESGAGDWVSSAINDGSSVDDWELGTPASDTIIGANSGSNAWKTDLDGTYTSSTRSQVVSPIFDLSNLPLVEISLAVWWETPRIQAGANLQISNDNGGTWTTIGAAGDPNNWYSSATVRGLAFTEGSSSADGWAGYNTAGTTTNDPGYASSGSYTGGSGSWVTARNTALGGGAQSRLRIAFGTLPDSFPDEGFAFDDVVITPALTAAQTDSLLVDADGDGQVDAGDTVRFTTTVTNNLSSALTSLTFEDLLNAADLELVAGSVTTDTGVVTTGNSGGDTTVAVNLGNLGSSTTATITFNAVVGSSSAAAVCAQGSLSATEFVSMSNVQTTDDPSTAAFGDSTCVPRVLLDTDGDGDPDVLDPDDDNDGVSDTDEMSDGTDPKDPGSVIERTNGEVCAEWNGFTDFLNQILEVRNTDSSPIDVEVRLFDQFRNVRDTINFDLASGFQLDVVVNALFGFTPNSYGLVCARVASGSAEALAGQLSTYRFTGTSYDLGFASEFLAPRAGMQCAPYNTYQPSTDPADAGNFVAGWYQLTNEETVAQSGMLHFYDQEGNTIRTDALSFAGRERRDIDAHGIGPNRTGLACWEPTSNTAKFRVRQNRYYYGAAGLSDLAAANSIPTRFGSGSELVAPFDTRGNNVAVEISNISNSPITVTAEVHDAGGALTPAQPPLLGIPAKGTRALVLNSFLASGLGSVKVSSSKNGSLIAVLVEYGAAADGSLEFANPSPLVPPLGTTTTASYNSFLAQGCVVQIASGSASAENAALTMTRYDGTVLINAQPIVVPANGALEIDLCVNETTAAYGEVRIDAANPNVLVGKIARQNAEATVELGSQLSP